MHWNTDSLIALVFCGAAILAMVVVQYRQGALSLRGVAVLVAMLVTIVWFLGSTLN